MSINSGSPGLADSGGVLVHSTMSFDKEKEKLMSKQEDAVVFMDSKPLICRVDCGREGTIPLVTNNSDAGDGR